MIMGSNGAAFQNVSDANTQKMLNDQLAQAQKDADTKQAQLALKGFEQAVQNAQ
jgi:hypothetical protein